MTLKEQMADDIGTVFLDTDEFAVDAVYTHEGADSTVKVIFDKMPDDNGEFLIPIVNVEASDVPYLARGDKFVIDGTSYGVISWFDQNGVMAISLNEEQS